MVLLWELRKDLENAADMVNQIEVIRSQLASITTLLDSTGALPGPTGVSSQPTSTSSGADYSAIRQAAAELEKKLIEVEENLIQRKLTGQGQDTVRWPPKLISKINYLANGIGSSDFPPTTQHREVKAMFAEQLASHRRRLEEILKKDLETFNKMLRDRGIQNVFTR